jgi:hypothetical protein
MATLGNANYASLNNTPRRLYISTAPFHSDFFVYNGKRLSVNPQATCITCPVGRILRENGRKLYPAANPGVTAYMVGVYDSVTFLNGFINPNDNVFAVYNSDRPTYIEDVETNYGSPVLTSGNIVTTAGFVGVQSTITDGATYAGSYLYTATGDDTEIPLVEAGVNFPLECSDSDIRPYTYATLYPNGTIESVTFPSMGPTTRVTLTANGNIYNTGNVSTLGNLYVDGRTDMSGNLLAKSNISTLGNLYVNGRTDMTGNLLAKNNISTLGTLSYTTGLRVPEPALAGVGTLNGGTVVGSFKKKYVTASGCRPGSRVFLTYLDQTGSGILSAEEITTGSFRIVSSNTTDTSNVQYFIVN